MWFLSMWGKKWANKEWDHEAAEANLWRRRGDIVLLRRRQSTKEGSEGRDGTFPKVGGRRWSSSGGEGTQQSNIKPTSMARNVVVTTVRTATKAARATATVAGATRTATTRAMTMTEPSPNQIRRQHQWWGTWWLAGQPASPDSGRKVKKLD